MGISVFDHVWQDFISLIYPRYCFTCEGYLLSGEQEICSKCLLDLPKTDFHQNIKNDFYTKLECRLPLKFVLAQFHFKKQGKVQKILHALKYKNHPEIGVMLGRVYGEVLSKSNFKLEFDLIIPVPLHYKRLKKRGYNQSLEFAKGLSESMGIPYRDDLICRIKRTETQTKRARLKRWQNVEEVFKVIDSEAIIDRKVLLVDDVITTGSTMEACGRVILKSQCKELSFACIAAAK